MEFQPHAHDRLQPWCPIRAALFGNCTMALAYTMVCCSKIDSILQVSQVSAHKDPRIPEPHLLGLDRIPYPPKPKPLNSQPETLKNPIAYTRYTKLLHPAVICVGTPSTESQTLRVLPSPAQGSSSLPGCSRSGA